jgi:hypothetical protein
LMVGQSKGPVSWGSVGPSGDCSARVVLKP